MLLTHIIDHFLAHHATLDGGFEQSKVHQKTQAEEQTSHDYSVQLFACTIGNWQN